MPSRSRASGSSASTRTLLALVSFWSTLCGVSPARAEAARSFDWLRSYEVVAGCPSEQAFRQSLAARVEQPVSEAFARLRLEIEVHRARDSHVWLGALRVRNEDAQLLSEREVSGASCASVSEALSLMAALSADASAPLDQPTTPEAVPERRDHGTTAAPAAARDFRTGVAALALADSAAAPGIATGLGVAIQIEWQHQSGWSPGLQLAASRLENRQTLDSGQIHARFVVTALQASACPWRVLGDSSWALRPCAGLEAGSISGAGTGVAVARTIARRGLWLSSELSLRGSLKIWGPLELATSLGATVPWVRHEFFLAPDRVVFGIPRLGWRGTGSLAATF